MIDSTFKMQFSDIEKQHLLKAWIAVSLAFAILMSDIFSLNFIIYFVISLVTVGTGFLFHELAHKLVAQKYGCWAEFRADDKMLIMAILSAFVGFVFAAPGAVFIHGNVTIERNGKISYAGPATNVLLALLFFCLTLLIPMGLINSTFNYGFQINSFIALFNMIPFLNFDGEKILKWNKPIYFITLSIAIFFVIFPRIL